MGFLESIRVQSKELECGFRVTYAGLSSSCFFGMKGGSYSNFLASCGCESIVPYWAPNKGRLRALQGPIARPQTGIR